MGLYFTGDCHGRFERFKDIEFLVNIDDRQNSTPEKNVIAIAGDFGGVFGTCDALHRHLKQKEESALDALQYLPFTFVFVDGNHENFPRLLSEFPEEEHFGGVTGRIRSNVYWLKQRGHIYDIQGYSVLAFGGATSFDKFLRKENIDWWPEERPQDDDYLRSMKELRANDMTVDFILTHNAPTEAVDYLHDNRAKRFLTEKECRGLSDPLPAFLQFIAERTLFRRWYFGHLHKDRAINIQSPYGQRAYRAVYRNCAIAEREEYGELEVKIRRT